MYLVFSISRPELEGRDPLATTVSLLVRPNAFLTLSSPFLPSSSSTSLPSSSLLFALSLFPVAASSPETGTEANETTSRILRRTTRETTAGVGLCEAARKSRVGGPLSQDGTAGRDHADDVAVGGDVPGGGSPGEGVGGYVCASEDEGVRVAVEWEIGLKSRKRDQA